MARQSLPERPDPDQLRRQAKELRRSALAGDRGAIERLLRPVDIDPSTVTLSTAQLVIAPSGREQNYRAPAPAAT